MSIENSANWKKIGKMQLDWLVDHGMEPHHKLLDYGCGPGRAADWLVDYLNSGNYLGIDINEKAINTARNRISKRFTGKAPGFMTMEQFSTITVPCFDYVIAHSVFTHCTKEQITTIMDNVDRVLNPEGVFFATCFEADEGVQRQRQGTTNTTTFSDRDPFHYPQSFWQESPAFAGWQVEWIGDWDHPRNQKMLRITRQP